MFLAKFYDLIWNENLGDTSLLTEFVLSSSGALVDLGCATGRVLSLAKQLNRQVIGIDQYPTMLELANEKLAKINVGTFRLINDDFCKFRVDEPFELVTCVANIFTMIVDSTKRLSLIKLIYERLPSRGKFLIWFMNDTGNFSAESQMQFPTPEGTLSYARNVIEDEIK